MFDQLRHSKLFVLFCLVSVLALFAVLTPLIATAKASQTAVTSKDITSLLNDYSASMNAGNNTYAPFSSSPMASLIQERKDYYNEFFRVGLHSNLVKLKSEFSDVSTILTAGDVTHLKVVEVVTLDGSSIIKAADEYPVIPAAEWALSRTDDPVVQMRLRQFIANTIRSVDESIANGFEMVFFVSHDMDLANKDGQLQIVRDAFTDKASDNGDGFDNATWMDGKAVRSRPDYSAMPDYQIYHTPVEAVGQQLLDSYTQGYSKNGAYDVTSTGYAGYFYYNREAAKNWALAHVSNTNITCPGTSYHMDTSYYGPLYQGVWSYTTTTCNDCADFVSQALRAGGFLSDSFWNSQGSEGHGTYGWRVFDFTTGSEPGLGYYLQTIQQFVQVEPYVQFLNVGDLLFTDGPGYHVVILTGINPALYSGHTNDRHDYAVSNPDAASLTNYWHINDPFILTYTFSDVPVSHWAWQEIERLYRDNSQGGVPPTH